MLSPIQIIIFSASFIAPLIACGSKGACSTQYAASPEYFHRASNISRALYEQTTDYESFRDLKPKVIEFDQVVSRTLEERALVLETTLYPPSPWFDINNLTSLAQLSQLMVNRMQTWYQPQYIPNYVWTQGWQIPLLGIALADLDLAFGNSANKKLVTDIISYNSDNNFVYDQYIDDQSWYGVFALRGYQAYGNYTWVQQVQGLIGINQNAGDSTCGGGLRWITYDYIDKNTITNTLHLSMLTRMYLFTGLNMYLTAALETLEWWLGWAFEPQTGQVWDTIQAPRCRETRVGLQAWTYNSGLILTGLADLYYATGNETLLDIGRSIAYAAIQDFTTDDGVLQESCEHGPPEFPGGPSGCGADLIAFKGALVLGMAEFYLARPDQNIYNFINTNLLSLLSNNLDNTWLAGQWWTGPFNESTAGPKTQLTAICLMAAAATVNSHFLNNVVLASAGNSSAPTISTNTTIAFPKALPSSMSFASSLSIPGSMLVLLLGSGGLLLL